MTLTAAEMIAAIEDIQARYPVVTRADEPPDWHASEAGPDTAEERHARHHRNCDAAWVCSLCERSVCPRCEPSPAEFEACAECDWNRSATCGAPHGIGNGAHEHHCPGDRGHIGPHWCLLCRHVWEATTTTEDA